CVKNTKNLNFEKLNNELLKRGIVISNGYGPMANKTFRVGHMGDTTLDDMKELTRIFDEILKNN
ncbi:MAG: alanine--glyoxylate aminotransferase family protein, partial [Peptoniphilaceae bacterium]|nr:alanine--glyoxylate aminotransferase family protein [Peptoniphilaceae bacterium]